MSWRVNVVACAPGATPGAWPKLPRIWSITFSRRYRCGNRCSPCPNGCAPPVSATRPCKAGCCAFSQGRVLRIFLSVVERCLREHSPACPVAAQIGAVAFIHRIGASLNQHVHFLCCVIDGVVESAVAPDQAPCVSFHVALARELDAAAFADVQARVRTRVLRTFANRGLIDQDDAAEMRAWAHDGGFSVDDSVDGSVRIEGANRVGQERLLRYCARPPFALTHLHQRDAGHLVYRHPKPVRGMAPGARPAALVPTPLELITKIAALVPPRCSRSSAASLLPK